MHQSLLSNLGSIPFDGEAEVDEILERFGKSLEKASSSSFNDVCTPDSKISSSVLSSCIVQLPIDTLNLEISAFNVKAEASVDSSVSTSKVSASVKSLTNADHIDASIAASQTFVIMEDNS